ncbi:peptidoglycan editing factor PgeF [Alphaproteobacteria bacterium]|nr:peptidoglycan editing factor PgeF [Alphaproteobacteria bacterium]
MSPPIDQHTDKKNIFAYKGKFLTPCPHGFFTRHGGVSTAPFDSLNFSATRGDPRENCLENATRALNSLGQQARQLIFADQVHGTDVAYVSSIEPVSHPCDALITDDPHCMIGVVTADCVPILIKSASSQWVAAIHAGWRGAVGGILQNTLSLLRQKTDEPLYGTIGPAIQQESYEVGPEVHATFIEKNPDFATFLKPQAHNDHFLLDVPGVVAHIAKEEGLSIEMLPLNTYTRAQEFFSCRRTTHEGNDLFGCQLSMIGLHLV